ncbi:MAG: carotenoid 1,2-hydratase [Pseudomonadota bacterium]
MNVDRDGYAWWYIDALSDTGDYGITIIAFIGSVFSPYYAWSKTRAPFEHCALNVALYAPRKNRWAMTERGRDSIRITPNVFQIGPSALFWDGDVLTIDINEQTSPIPASVRGVVRLHPQFINDKAFAIDRAKRHIWRPIAPSARIEVNLEKPDIRWDGSAYFDTNRGTERLEHGFDFWDWARADIGGGESAILYNTDLPNGDHQSMALRFSATGEISDVDIPNQTRLSPTPIWRINRRTRTDAGAQARVIRTLEDTPFYSRSVIETRLFGNTHRAVHECFSGKRYGSPIIKSMLRFRMPRRP